MSKMLLALGVFESLSDRFRLFSDVFGSFSARFGLFSHRGSFSTRFGAFSQHFVASFRRLRRRNVVFGVVVHRSIKKTSKKIFKKELALILHIGVGVASNI